MQFPPYCLPIHVASAPDTHQTLRIELMSIPSILTCLLLPILLLDLNSVKGHGFRISGSMHFLLLGVDLWIDGAEQMVFAILSCL